MQAYFMLLTGLLGSLGAVLGYLLFRKNKKALEERLNYENQIFELQKQEAVLRSQLEHEQAKTKERQDQEQNFEKYLHNSFKSLASQVLEGQSNQFLQLAKSTFEQEQIKSKQELDKKQSSFEELIQPIREKLEAYKNEIQQMEKTRLEQQSRLSQEIKQVFEAASHLQTETNALKNALKKPHVRGRWGEVQLKNCVEIAGMSEFADVSFQEASKEEEKVLIPDMTVRMPGGRVIIVDAKTPLEAFISSLEATTEAEKTQHMTRHGQHIKDHVKKLSSKAYNEALKDSPDFTVLFLPNESFLYAALETQPDLVEYALEKKILIATPPTFIGLLKVIRFGWNEERIAENAEKISEAGKELHKRVADFMTAFSGIGKHLDKAKQEFETAGKRLNSRVLVQAKRLEKLGAKSHKSIEAEELLDNVESIPDSTDAEV